jgi:hypothetical protein
MWSNLKTRQCAFYQVYVTTNRDSDVKAFLKANKNEYSSRSNMVQAAVLQKLGRDKPLLSRNPAIDPLRLAQCLSERRVDEKRIARRVVRWCLVLDVAVDIQVRAFLREYGARHGALCRYIDDAILELIDPTKRRNTAAKEKVPRDAIHTLSEMPLPPLRTAAINDFGVGQHT